jgi:hypothetical protein
LANPPHFHYDVDGCTWEKRHLLPTNPLISIAPLEPNSYALLRRIIHVYALLRRFDLLTLGWVHARVIVHVNIRNLNLTKFADSLCAEVDGCRSLKKGSKLAYPPHCHHDVNSYTWTE